MAKTGKTHRATTNDPNALGREFKRRVKTKRGPALLGGIVSEMLRPSLARIYKHAGFDFIYIETEHMLYNGRDVADFVLAARGSGLPVVAKIADLNRPEVIRLMDCGIVGIQLPRTETREQVEQLLDWMRFPPKGSRPGDPVLGAVDYVWPDNDAKWLKDCDDATMMVAHIETALGYENIEDIVTTPGLDMLYVGPYDFSISLGHPGQYDHPQVKKAIRRILDLCVKHGVAFGTTTSGAKPAAQYVKRGCRFFEVIDELGMIHTMACQTVDAFQTAMAKK